MFIYVNIVLKRKTDRLTVVNQQRHKSVETNSLFKRQNKKKKKANPKTKPVQTKPSHVSSLAIVTLRCELTY